MGAIFSCFHVPDGEGYPSSSNSCSIDCCCPKCFIQKFLSKHKNVAPRQETMSASANNQDGVSSNSEVVENYSSDERRYQLPYDAADEDVCPTCLEEYDKENPKIIAKCNHHFHLSCIYEWMERSSTCPVCRELMLFDE